jgi:ADP-ribosylglycohydrolase
VRGAAAELARRHPEIAAVVDDAARDIVEDLTPARADDPGLAPLLHRHQGFVRVAFRLAFWELAHAAGFEDGLVDVVNRGGDADTNGAIAGALLGARFGEGGIPARWRESVLGALRGEDSVFAREYHPRVLLSIL